MVKKKSHYFAGYSTEKNEGIWSWQVFLMVLWTLCLRVILPIVFLSPSVFIIPNCQARIGGCLLLYGLCYQWPNVRISFKLTWSKPRVVPVMSIFLLILHFSVQGKSKNTELGGWVLPPLATGEEKLDLSSCFTNCLYSVWAVWPGDKSVCVCFFVFFVMLNQVFFCNIVVLAEMLLCTHEIITYLCTYITSD